MAIPRRLEIDVYVVGQQAADGTFPGAAVSYIATHTIPTMPGLVDFRTGNINLDAITFASRNDPNYLMDIDITYTLRPFMFDMNGNPVQAIFATPTALYGCLLVNPQGKPPKAMSATAINAVKIMVDNDNAEENRPTAERTYGYGLGMILPAFNNYFISLDPTVLKKGPPLKK